MKVWSCSWAEDAIWQPTLHNILITATGNWLDLFSRQHQETIWSNLCQNLWISISFCILVTFFILLIWNQLDPFWIFFEKSLSRNNTKILITQLFLQKLPYQKYWANYPHKEANQASFQSCIHEPWLQLSTAAYTRGSCHWLQFSVLRQLFW